MSGNNVHAQIAQYSETLADKLASNNDLSNVILALLGRLVIMCQQRGLPLEGLTLSPMDTRYLGKEFIISTHLTFSRLAIRPPTLWTPQSEFMDYTAARARGLALALAKNPSLNTFFQSLVEKIQSYGNHKRIPFVDLRIKTPFISKDDVLVIGVGKEL